MNILIDKTTSIVRHMSQDGYVPLDDSWSQNGSKVGIATGDADQAVVENDPPYIMFNVYQYVGGQWVIADQAEYDNQLAGITQHQADLVIADRDLRLKASDWTVLPDLPASFTSVWAAYRQELRDVPNQPGFPWNPLPTPPAQKTPSGQASTNLASV